MITKLLDRNLDRRLVWSVVALMCIGVLMVHSASQGENLPSSDYWLRQAIWMLFSIVVALGIILIPVKFIYAFSYVFYAAAFLLLLLVEIAGTTGGGSERWLVLGPVRIQPSEFMKVAIILALARYMSFKKNRPTTYPKIFIPGLFVLFPLLLVLKQPDLGTSMIYCALIFPMLYWAGLDRRRLFFLVAPILSAVFAAPFIPWFNWLTWVTFMFIILGFLYYCRYSLPVMGAILCTNILAGIATPIAFSRLKPYQQERITTFINPEADPLGTGYQILNSKVAVGSGGILGKGIGNGSYTEMGFLPKAHTDFIFSIVGEELGFIGTVMVILLFGYIIYRGILIAQSIRNQFMALTVVGICGVLLFHVYINVGMVLGLMPVTGKSLPFLSYGGSSFLANAIMIGILLNFSVNRHDF
jgi:rod shape determining protein RodA